ncbi:MAG TPA: ferritin-like domain-containing protein [Burkholderiales bacterium]|nr:ferritin-like domain-containing protein [Burkholderiales bacterium]
MRRAAERLMRRDAPPASSPQTTVPWDAQFFGLPRSARFRSAGQAEQRAVIEDCAAELLSESWFIERSGVVYCARMTFAADADDERRLFALIGADEATHSAWLEPWIRDRAASADPFSRLIAGLVDAGGTQPLAYLLQIVLEGFGIAHYANLAAGCRDEALAAVLKRMAQDEAAHHAAGLAAFSAARLGDAERRFLADASYAFLQMIRIGPQAVVGALDRHVGIGGEALIAGVFEDLDAGAAADAKLRHLRRLFAQPGMESLVDELEQKGAFSPCTAAQCAAVYTGAR